MDNKSVLYQLMDTRMGEALHKITKEDTAFMQTKEKADKYAAKLASLNLPEETMRLIDQYVNERSANWVIGYAMESLPICSAFLTAKNCFLAPAIFQK